MCFFVWLSEGRGGGFRELFMNCIGVTRWNMLYLFLFVLLSEYCCCLFVLLSKYYLGDHYYCSLPRWCRRHLMWRSNQIWSTQNCGTRLLSTSEGSEGALNTYGTYRCRPAGRRPSPTFWTSVHDDCRFASHGFCREKVGAKNACLPKGSGNGLCCGGSTQPDSGRTWFDFSLFSPCYRKYKDRSVQGDTLRDARSPDIC